MNLFNNKNMANEILSEHDEKILEKIREIDERWCYLRWLDISALADELESKEQREYWNRICISYNHTEEYYAGCS